MSDNANPFVGHVMRDTHYQRADMSGSHFDGVNVTGANLSGATFTNVNLSGISISRFAPTSSHHPRA